MNITLQFIPHSEMASLSSEERVDKLLQIVKKNKIVLMEGRLNPDEETSLIQKTMESISKTFKGIELYTPPEHKEEKIWQQLRSALVKLLVGTKGGMTIIGPATVVKEIKRNPNKIELLTKEQRRARRS